LEQYLGLRRVSNYDTLRPLTDHCALRLCATMRTLDKPLRLEVIPILSDSDLGYAQLFGQVADQCSSLALDEFQDVLFSYALEHFR
jgi:hypothetical protein